MPKFPHKPDAPSARQHLGPAISRARALSGKRGAITRKELVEEILRKLDLPAPVQSFLRERHKLDE